MDSKFNNFILEDVLNPRDSAKLIVKNTKSDVIKINNDAVIKVAEKICNSTLNEIGQLNFAECEFHPKNADKEAVDCGYFGVCLAINRALGNGIPLTSANYMANINGEAMNEIFRGDNVSFLKRAQILVADVYSCLHEKDSNANFNDINELTMFADYRVPQALAYLGVLEYGDIMLQLLNKPLKCGSEEEIQIRGFSIEACELILNEIKNICNSTPKNNSISPDLLNKLNNFNCVDVDVWLWIWRRANAQKIEESIPFHKCRSIFY
uniref:Queuosine 5'-phosphate N-glycosylase/hydrolase n=1 Tax=Meloidogyne hapla TaxID=6305 RepID=A0A1I8AXT4_MELHA